MEVTMYEMQEESKTYKDRDVYSFRDKGKAPWLQKLCFKVLRRLGCDNAIYYEKSVKRVAITPKTITENLYRQHRTILQRAHDLQGVIYMGPEEFRTLAGETMGESVMRVTVPYNVDGQFYGLDIITVPWMKGILVAPKHKSHIETFRR